MHKNLTSCQNAWFPWQPFEWNSMFAILSVLQIHFLWYILCAKTGKGLKAFHNVHALDYLSEKNWFNENSGFLKQQACHNAS